MEGKWPLLDIDKSCLANYQLSRPAYLGSSSDNKNFKSRALSVN
jgi:hypothetical protein